jgi:hypothetical protein
VDLGFFYEDNLGHLILDCPLCAITKFVLYGAAWSASMDVALSYAATGMWRTSDGGSVLLEAFAPREAIVCAPGLLDDRYGEQEYVVDRRLLKAITVIERF